MKFCSYGVILFCAVMSTAACSKNSDGSKADLASNPNPDLAGLPPDFALGADQGSGDGDMNVPPDLSRPRTDMAAPIDMTAPIDMAMRPVSGTLEIDFGSGIHASYTDFYYADAYYYPPPSTSLIRIQQNAGHSVWAVYVGDGIAPGSVVVDANFSSDKLTITLAESSPSLPGALLGSWQYSTGSGTLTTVDLRNGGRIVGSASGSLTHITTGAVATFRATFSAVLR